MRFKDIRWLWKASAAVCDGEGIVYATRRARFLVKASAEFSAIEPIIRSPRGTAMANLLQQRPEVIGAVIWPYQCVGWSPRVRLARIRDHYAAVEKIGRIVDFPVNEEVSLLDLDHVKQGLRIVLDQPVWFMREGQLAINLFIDDVRMYTLAFSLFQENGSVSAFIGAIQGRDIEGVLDVYRELTKAANGMRPRDFLIEIFRMFCAELGLLRILAVGDRYRHHRDEVYFGKQAGMKEFSSNYDEVWADRGAVRVDPMFFQLPIESPQRDVGTIPAKKRGIYRRRFEMLGELRKTLHERVAALTEQGTL